MSATMKQNDTKNDCGADERRALAEKLDEDLDAFIESKKANSKGPDLQFDTSRPVDELVEELKQHPAFMTEFDPSKPMSPAMEALMQLKYNPEDAQEKAENYKEDGNYNFKHKKYRWAIENYSEAIKACSSNKDQNAVLFSNRAAANYRLQNWRSSWKDCVLALKFKPDHMKAIIKGASSLFEMRRYADSIEWCDKGLCINPDEEQLIKLRNQAELNKKKAERDERKQKALERKAELADKNLLETIRSRGVKLSNPRDKDGGKVTELSLSSLESKHPSGARVHLDESGCLNWPVLFLYPEYTETDFIEAFNESAMFMDHMQHMFGSHVERPPWDEDNKYTPDTIQIYFEDQEREKLVPVSMQCTLGDILKHDRFFVQVGTPAFILLVKQSPFEKHFLTRYK